MKAEIHLTHKEVKQAIKDYIERKACVTIDEEQLQLEVKSKQNYKAEWEQAETRVKCELDVQQ